MNKTIKQELQSLVPNSGLTSIWGKFGLRFELGGEGNSDPSKRILQATERGVEIFRRVIGVGELIVVIEEWDSSWLRNGPHASGEYLHAIIGESVTRRIKGPFEQTIYEKGEDGNKIEKRFEDDLECDLSIGKIQLSTEQIEAVIKGIVSLEMGGEPCVTQRVYFFSPERQTGILVYDDRGCDVWANNLESLRPIYEGLRDWILFYNREEIDAMFVV